jgi:hypothetical protein
MPAFFKRLRIWFGLGLTVYLVPILWSAFGTHGYFEGIRSWGGASSYYFFRNDTFCELRPGQGDWGHPVYSLRPVADGWEARSIVPASVAPASNYTFVVMTNDNRANDNRPPLRLRLQGGDLYELWGTNWMRFPRVYNVWSVWFQQFFPPPSEKKAQHISCVNNLKQIGLAFRIWAGDNNDQYPFNVSTNAGGTLELCDRDANGFERNSFLHFLVASNELSTPLVLHCPQDRSKTATRDWGGLSASNVTYRLLSGTNVSDANPHAILAVCPMDGNVLYCDGTVMEKGVKPESKQNPLIFDLMKHQIEGEKLK